MPAIDIIDFAFVISCDNDYFITFFDFHFAHITKPPALKK